MRYLKKYDGSYEKDWLPVIIKIVIISLIAVVCVISFYIYFI